MTDFPKCKQCLKWYLHPARDKCIFPALASEEFSGTKKNTQAQESQGHTIQQTRRQKHPTIPELFLHLYKIACKVDMEYSCAY